MTTCVVDTRQGDGRARIVRATVAWAMKACRQASNIGTATPRTIVHSPIRFWTRWRRHDEIDRQTRPLDLTQESRHQLSYRRSSISAIMGACLLKAGNIPSSGLHGPRCDVTTGAAGGSASGACLLKAGNIPSSGLRQQINS